MIHKLKNLNKSHIFSQNLLFSPIFNESFFVTF